MKRSRRDDLIGAALGLFYKYGYNATGIERILATAGVAKPTLYRHFKSKDELILAALHRWDEDSRAWLRSEMEKRGRTPRERLLALYDVLGEWFATKGFQGCMFINAAVEFSEHENPIHKAAAAHKRSFAAYVRDLVAAAGAERPGDVTERLMIVMEGAIVTAHTTGAADAASQARRLAEMILADSLDGAETPASTAVSS